MGGDGEKGGEGYFIALPLVKHRRRNKSVFVCVLRDLQISTIDK